LPSSAKRSGNELPLKKGLVYIFSLVLKNITDKAECAHGLKIYSPTAILSAANKSIQVFAK